MSLLYELARGTNAIARWTPQAARHTLGSMVGVGSYLSWRSKRLVTQQNMAQVTGRSVHDPYVRHLALASWRNYGRYAADFMHFPYIDINESEKHLHDLSQGGSSWQEYLEHALQRGRGVLISTAHFGNWDMAGAFIARHAPLSAVAETFRDERLNRMLQNQRTEKGVAILPMEGSPRRILRVLQQNQVVALVVDRPVEPGQGIPVSFCGRTTYVPSGPAALALKSGAAILPGYVWYGHRNQWYGRMFPPIFPQPCKGEERNREVARLTQCMYDALETMVREWPTQWYMFRPFWPPCEAEMH